MAPLRTQSADHHYESAVLAAGILSENGFEAYIIGGAVRDMWLGRAPKDFDLVTDATPVEITAIRDFQTSVYSDTAQAYGVTRVKFTHEDKPIELEIATFRIDIEAHLGRRATKVVFAELSDDVLRRDFTINALALDPATNQVIDIVGGIEDLEKRCIRFIGDPAARIREDPLRIMRAIRFKNQLGFSYHPATAQAIKEAVESGHIEAIAVDRLRTELTNMLIGPDRRQALLDLDEFGILERVLPEVTAGKGVLQPPQFHAEGDVWQHELLIMEYLPANPSRQLVWASLLHDIGKGPTRFNPHKPGDRIRFDRHYAVGAEMAKSILRRLKFSNQDIKVIVWMIQNHLNIDYLPVMRPSHRQKMLGHPAFEDLLELHKADAAASWRPDKQHGIKPAFEELEHIWHKYQSSPPEQRQPSLKRDLGIDGNWLISNFSKELGSSDGPIIGKVLDGLDEWYRDEGVKDKRRYIVKARELINRARG